MGTRITHVSGGFMDKNVCVPIYSWISEELVKQNTNLAERVPIAEPWGAAIKYVKIIKRIFVSFRPIDNSPTYTSVAKFSSSNCLEKNPEWCLILCFFSYKLWVVSNHPTRMYAEWEMNAIVLFVSVSANSINPQMGIVASRPYYYSLQY